MNATALACSLMLCGSTAPTRAAPAPVAGQKPATSAAKAKDSLEAQFARQELRQVLDAANSSWFGRPYAEANAVDLQGSMTISLTAAALNAKVGQLGQGAVQGGMTKGANVNLKLKGTYFANADFRTELTGEFGHLLYCRVGNKGFLYSKEQNAWTSRVDPPPADAPASFLGWFRQCFNDVQKVYADGTTFKASMGKDTGTSQTLVFSQPTGPYDPRKREQSLAESLGFWKRGRLEVTFDKSTRLPQQMTYRNDAQGINTHLTFSYNPGGRPNTVSIANQSRGMEGPASLTLSYDANGRISHLAGLMGYRMGTLAFDLDLAFAKGRTSSAIVTVPPPTAVKKGREELETLLLVNLAGRVLDLQRSGFNLRSVTLANG